MINMDPSVIAINHELCVGCGLCAKVCRAGAISLIFGKARVNPLACTGCGYCLEVCRTGAICWRELRRRVSQKPSVRHGWPQQGRFFPGQQVFRESTRGNNDLNELKQCIQDLKKEAQNIVKRIERL